MTTAIEATAEDPTPLLIPLTGPEKQAAYARHRREWAEAHDRPYPAEGSGSTLYGKAGQT